MKGLIRRAWGAREGGVGGFAAGERKRARKGKKEDGVTYQARQADLTGGAANFFLVTPLALALGAAAAEDAVTGAGCSAMTGFAGSLVSMRRR